MTVPIVPGPWSFLANIGQGIAGYGVGREQHRVRVREEEQEDRREALDKLGFMFRGIQTGDIKSDVVKSPLFLSLLERSGLGAEGLAENIVPNPQAAVRGAAAAAVPGAIEGLSRGGQRQLAATGKIPTAGEEASDATTALRAGAQGAAIAGGGASGRAAAGVLPEATAFAAEEAAKEPLYNNVAGTSVDATLTQLKVQRLDPSNIGAVSEGAWALAQADAKARGFVLDQEITKRYIDAAIQMRLRQQEELDIRRLSAQNQSRDPMTDMFNFYQRQQQRVNDAIKSLEKPSLVDEALADGIERTAHQSGRTVEQVLNDPNTSPMQKKKYYEVRTYRNQFNSLQVEAQGYRDNLGQLLGGRVGAPDPSAVPVPSERRDIPGTGSFESSDRPDASGKADRVAKLTRAAQLFDERRKDPKNKGKSDDQLAAEIKKELKL